MKASELRIGNLFQDAKDRLCSVNEIYKDIEECRIESIHGCITSLPIKPIPLTEEWLLKFGFKEYGGTTKAFEIEKCVIDFDVRKIWTYQFNHEVESNIVEYVHQLQNLVHALTNEELTLKQD